MLADLWTKGPDRNAITTAANRIDEQLSYDPHNQGESRDGRFRILFEPPLVVDYEIDDAKREVKVLRIRRTKA